MDKIILIGSGGHARSCIDVIELTGKYEIVGLVDKEHRENNSILGYPVIGTDEDLPILRKKYKYAIITVGQIKSPVIRENLFKKLIELNYKLPVIISPNSYISKHSKIGKGTVIFNDVIINANVSIGENCIINNKALVEHDSIIGNNCHISTGVRINGGVTIGNGTFIGSGAITREYISIGNQCIVGAGQIIKDNLQSNSLVK